VTDFKGTSHYVTSTNMCSKRMSIRAGADPGPKFTDDLRTILKQFSDLRQPYDNWQIHRTFMTILGPILRQLLCGCNNQ